MIHVLVSFESLKDEIFSTAVEMYAPVSKMLREGGNNKLSLYPSLPGRESLFWEEKDNN